ncbi:XRE family transcriptional regulator [Apibacter muscae]|uniref:helix-turn-helix domain-containing protein n=1 Tax=Apibacter muscae TaxID=2509004 RepID=UPI0011AC808A|nr:helix-turn-helix transcriptional regulator [Apibacter muscae]TWP24249.1 XRE family transcriptional regulator [Apibacter muscae]
MDAIIGKNIKLLRDKIGLSQEDLAEYLGLSNKMQVSRYEKGTTSVPTIHMTKLADLFGVDEYDFYEEDEDNIKLNVAFAFRANELQSSDMEIIASFKKLAMNYLKMKKTLANE